MRRGEKERTQTMGEEISCGTRTWTPRMRWEDSIKTHIMETSSDSGSCPMAGFGTSAGGTVPECWLRRLVLALVVLYQSVGYVVWY
jgi:hypothetical protein